MIIKYYLTMHALKNKGKLSEVIKLNKVHKINLMN